MWSSARALVLLLSLALAACGFRPMYGGGQNAAVNAHLAAVHIAPIPDRLGQEVRNALEQRFAAAGQGERVYTLAITLEERIQELGVRRDATARRANIRVLVDWQLIHGDRILRTGATEAISAYNILEQHFATEVSKRDARSKAAQQIADEIARQLAVYFARAAS